jgi:hypothetical protein
MIKKLAVVSLCLVFILGSLASAAPKPKLSGGKNMKSELEAAYNSLRKAISDKKYDALSNILEPAKNGIKIPPKEKLNDEAWGGLLEIFQDLSTTKFIKVEQKGDWAGYYMLTDVDDPNYITIDLLKFHKVGGKWKVSGSRFSSSIQKEGDATKAIEQEIKNNPGFKLP